MYVLRLPIVRDLVRFPYIWCDEVVSRLYS